MNLDTYNYYRNQKHREEIQRASRQQQLSQVARGPHRRSVLMAVRATLLALWTTLSR